MDNLYHMWRNNQSHHSLGFFEFNSELCDTQSHLAQKVSDFSYKTACFFMVNSKNS